MNFASEMCNPALILMRYRSICGGGRGSWIGARREYAAQNLGESLFRHAAEGSNCVIQTGHDNHIVI